MQEPYDIETPPPGLPPRQGLYDPAFEHDACGVGMICHVKGEPSHMLVRSALRILLNLAHRGATGADARTGDGAGMLMQMPQRFMAQAAAEAGIVLPEAGAYGAGMVFLPPQPAAQKRCVELFEQTVHAEGQVVLGWRDVPVAPEHLGEIARRAMPTIRMLFVGRGPGLQDAAHFERKLYVIRMVVERAIRAEGAPWASSFHVPSLSGRTIVYKGLLLADQIEPFFPDLKDPAMETAVALVHQRFSTNTFPTWDLAHPFRFICHNGEINTLRGNVNWMRARQGQLRSDVFGDDLPKLFPILTPQASDSATLDNAIEFLCHAGRSLPHVMSMLIPEAWENHRTMPDDKKAYYEYHAALMEPWDGPATIPFTDGRYVGAVLDRNGLRPSRYVVTKDDFVILASEVGVMEIAPQNIAAKGRLQPGRMLLIDLEQQRLIPDDEIKTMLAARQPYRTWIEQNRQSLRAQPEGAASEILADDALRQQQRIFGYTLEDQRAVLAPMAQKGIEPTGSMGTDTPLAVLSEKPQLLYNYFHQLFAQVTNPPLDAIREELVTSLGTFLGSEGNLCDETPEQARRLFLDSPVLTPAELASLRAAKDGPFKALTLSTLYPVAEGGAGMEKALAALFETASAAIRDGARLLILSDRGADRAHAPIPALLATAGLHHHLIREAQRTQCGLIVESAEPREVHHFALLYGYGAGAVQPYLAMDTIRDLAGRGFLEELDADAALVRYRKAIDKGLLKIMSKMGISTIRSYRGAQIFEAVGLADALIDRYFTGTPSRLDGLGLNEIARETSERHAAAFPSVELPDRLELEPGGQYQWRRHGETHILDPLSIAKLQQATRSNDEKVYAQFSDLVSNQQKKLCTLRSLLQFRMDGVGVPLEEVEPWERIVRRFKTGAMSYGSISREAHETLAVAMNRLGGRSNSGEGGEDADRYGPDPRGAWRRSAIKQVASGRFGVTSHYLVNATELQIKLAQGAKPGEGGQLPGFKVYPWIAKTRFSTPYVTLISPPPHHDIYSIEDLAQLIHDLKNGNSYARVDVKLVAEVGVGTVAAGVAKGKADLVLISGFDGGTGASPLSSIKHAGLPWELGLAETQQTLVLNDLRDRITVECDGKLLTGRDVAIACLLGAEEFGFSAGPLVTLGCIMMRVCHLNTCPVGIATQDPELRAKFAGKPEHVINYFRFVAEEMRRLMAAMGFRTVDDMVGQVDRLDLNREAGHWKSKTLAFDRILYKPKVSASVGVRCTRKQHHGLEEALDLRLIRQAEPALERGEKVELDLDVRNVNRTVGTMLSSRISQLYGEEGLPADTIVVHAKGSAGQSFGAFGARGLTLELEGDANDYLGKGLSGAKLIVFPSKASTFVPEENVLIGNVAFYGATAGEAYLRGLAGERFCVRNSGVQAVVEGIGDHGCEYMTGGRVVILGPTGRNFAAGMSGGVAYVLDEAGDFGAFRCNREMVELEAVESAEDIHELKTLIQRHLSLTKSAAARRVFERWDDMLPRFVKVMPTDYKRALAMLATNPSD